MTTEREVYRDASRRIVVEQSLDVVEQKSDSYCQLIVSLSAVAIRIESGDSSERIELDTSERED